MKCRVATSTLVAGQLQSTWDPTFPVSQTNQYDNHKDPDNVKSPASRLSVVTMLAFSRESAALCAMAQTQAGNIENRTRALRARPRRLQRPNAQGADPCKTGSGAGCRLLGGGWTIGQFHQLGCMHGCDSSAVF